MARFLAVRRYRSNRHAGNTNKKIGPQSDEETDLQGIGAEIAYCKIFNLYPDTEISTVHPTEDCVTKDGNRCDVKATKYRNGHIIIAPWKSEKKPCDIYVLMIGEFPRYRYAGYINGIDIIKEEKLRNFGYGNSYAANQGELSTGGTGSSINKEQLKLF